MKNSRLGLKVTDELRQKLDERADELKLSISNLIRLCIEHYFEKNPKTTNKGSNQTFENSSTWFNELVEEKDSRISDLNREIEKKNKQLKKIIK